MARIIITLGDPAGIGPEVIALSLASEKCPSGHEFVVIGDGNVGSPGKPDPHTAAAAWRALDHAISALKSGQADAVVTGPICKEGMQAIGFPFPGQTEFFAAAFGIDDYGMVLSGNTLTVGLATIHEPISAVPRLLDIPSIMRIGKLTADFIARRKRIHPRIAVAGLNPHAGEHGAFGDEEARIISPAIRQLNALGIASFSGPAVPDAIFREAAAGDFDAVIAMYHDQGLIPLKLLDFDSAVNLTVGLPFPRTSPDHGTAFGIAGKGIANPSSMIAAIRMACELLD